MKKSLICWMSCFGAMLAGLSWAHAEVQEPIVLRVDGPGLTAKAQKEFAAALAALPADGLGLPDGFWTNDNTRAFSRWVSVTNQVEVASLSQQALSSVASEYMTNLVVEASSIRDAGFYKFQRKDMFCFYLVVDVPSGSKLLASEITKAVDFTSYPRFTDEVYRKFAVSGKYVRWDETIVPKSMHDTMIDKTTLISLKQSEMVIFGLSWWMDAEGYEVLRTHNDFKRYLQRLNETNEVLQR